MKSIKNIAILFIAICLLQVARSQVQKCQNPQYIIPYQPLDSAFDTGIDTIRGYDQLTALVQDPNAENGKNYLLSLAPFSAPLFAMAGVTLIIFIATIVQVICFNSCSKGCCGNEINSSTYNVCCMKTMVGIFLILCFLTVAISIAALILNSDLQKSIDYTQCNTQNIIYQGYNGNNNPSMQWSGVNNFQSSINLFSVAIQNNVPFLMTYFSSTNPSYTSITNTGAGSTYANSQIFNCQNSAATVSCPFPSSQQTCPSPYQATFNSQFCNQSFVGSGSNLVQSEMQNNSTSWLTNTLAISSSLSVINTNPTQVSSLVTSVSNFTTSVTVYETDISNGFDQLDIVQGGISIAFYVFYSFTLGLALFGMVVLCMTYYCNVFKCRYFLYIIWYFFALLSLLLFVDSGLFLGGSVAFQDSCLAYPYYFNNVTNFNKLTFPSANTGNIFKTCFYSSNGNSKSIFSGFSDTSILTQFGTLYSQYQKAIPSPQFWSVVSTIQNQFQNYAANPNTVLIEATTEANQPQTALNQMNLFANFSAPGSTQSCRLTKDYITYDVINCNLYLTNQNVGQNTCVVLAASNLNTIVTQRVDAFNNKGCNIDGSSYQDRINALSAYGNSIQTIALQLAPVQQTNPATPLQAYQNNYYGYYSSVLNFYNNDIQQIFNGFFNPYNSLMAGSNCGFVTSSMNGIVNIACNQLQAYISSYAVLNIIQSAFLFIIFLLAYFLTVRMEFYEYLDGNFANFGVVTVSTKSLQKSYELDSTNRNVELLSVNNSQL